MLTIIVQKYLAPYRINLFNEINDLTGDSLSLIYYGKPEQRRKWDDFPGILFEEFESKSISFKRNYEKNITIPFSLFCDLRKINPDVIICAPDLSGLIIKNYASIFNKKYLIWLESTVYNEADIPSYIKKIRRYILKSANSIIVPGVLTKDYLKTLNIKKKTYIAYNTIDLTNYLISEDMCNKKFCNNETYNLTFSGSLVERKGINILLNVIEKLNKENNIPKYKFNILGDGPFQKKEIENVRYMGFLRGVDYYNLLKDSHIFVMPSLYDCNPLAMIEAAASGNALLASEAVGNHPELIHDNGLVFEANNTDSLFNSLLHVLKRPKREIKDMALKSIEISKKFSHSETAKQFIEAIKNAYAAKKG